MSGELLFREYEKPAGARLGVHQGEWWVTAVDEWLRIEEMPLGHVESVMRMLVHRAPSLADREWWRAADYIPGAGDMAADRIEREMDEMMRDPERWLKSTTLYRALKKRRKVLRKQLKKIKPIVEAGEVDPGWTWTDEQ